MKKWLLLVALCLAASGVIMVMSCGTTPPSPYVPKNANVSVYILDSRGVFSADSLITEFVGTTVKVGVCPYLSTYIDSVGITMLEYHAGLDSQIVIRHFSSDADTQWIDFTLTRIRKYTVNVDLFQGGTKRTLKGEIQVVGKPAAAEITPATDTCLADSLATFTVTPHGDDPYAFQWFHGPALLTGKTGISLNINRCAIADSGEYTCLVKDKWGDSVVTAPARLVVVSATIIITNKKPRIDVTGHTTILSFEVCSLFVSVADADSADSLKSSVVKGPSGYTYSGGLFTWAPYPGYLGADSARTDTAIFMVTDNGKPPLSDTQKVLITVSAKIFPPDSVKGLAGVSRYNGSFVFKWNKSANADEYAIYRSRDTAGFSKYATTPDTSFTNNIMDTAFYYYVIATNSKKSSPQSPRIHSTDINDAPKWSHDTIKVTINEGAAYSFNCADSCKDTNGDLVSFQLVSGGPATDSLLGTTWKYSPSYNDSGAYAIKIKAFDGIDSSAVTISLHVVNVNRPPVISGAKDTTIAEGASIALTVTATDPDGDAVTISADTIPANATFNPSTGAFSFAPSSSQNGANKVVFSATDGKSPANKSITITVSNVPVPVISLQPVTHSICAGVADSFSVAASGQGTLTYQWQKNQADIPNETKNVLKISAVSVGDTGSYVCVVSNVGGKTYSAAAILTVATPSIAPTGATASAASICSGSVDTLSIVGGTLGAGSSWKWYATSAYTAPAIGTGMKITVSPTSTTTYYVRAEGTCGNTTAVDSVTVVVGSPSIAATGAAASFANICSGSADTLSVVGGTLGAGCSWKWYTTSTYTPPAIATGAKITVTPTSTVKYYVRAEGPCGNTTAVDTVTVSVTSSSTPPTGVTASFPSVCSGSVDTLSVVGGTLGAGASWKWYTTSTYTAPAIGTGAKITAAPTSTTTYYVRAEGTCGNTTDIDTVTVVIATASVAPTSVTASAASICAGSPDVLSVVGGTLGAGASWKWYTNAGYTTLAGTGASITVTPSSTTKYYVRAESGCGNTTDVDTVTVTVNTLSTSPTGAAASFAAICSGSVDTLSVVGGTLGSGAAWKWYTTSTYTAPAVATGAKVVVNPSSTTKYYVRGEGPCGNTAAIDTVTVTVNTPSTAPTGASVSFQTICQGSVDTLKAVGGTLGTGATWKWYTDQNYSNAVAGGNSGSPLVVSPSATTKYWVRGEGACGNTTAVDTVTITVNIPSTAPTSVSATPAAICSGSSSSLSITGGTLGTGASWKWYTDQNYTTAVPGSNSGIPLVVSPTSTTKYYVRAEGTCGNTTAVDTVTVTVNTPSSKPTSASATPATICSGSTSSLNISGGTLGTGAAWKWYTDLACTSPVVGTGVPLSVSPTSTTTYYVRAEGACGNTSPAVGVAVTVNASSTAPTSASATPATICPGSSSSLNISGGTLGTGAAWKWYTDLACTSPAVGTGVPLSVSPASTTTYYVRAEGTCGNTSPAVAAAVTVNPLPAINQQPTTQTKRAGNSVTFTVGLSNSGSFTYQWQKGTTAINGATSSSYSISSVAHGDSNTTYRCVISSGTCSVTSSSATLNVVSVSQVAAGMNHSLILMSDGTVWGCGDNSYGQLGDGTSTNRNTPVQVKWTTGGSAVTGVKSIAAGYQHSIIVMNDRTVYLFGNNGTGQLGIGSANSDPNPNPVRPSYLGSYLDNIKSVDARGNFSLFLRNDGTYYACGYNNDGELGDGSAWNNSAVVELIAMPSGSVRTMSAGENFSIIIGSDYNVYATGMTIGSSHSPSNVYPNCKAAYAGYGFFFVMANDGTGTISGYGQNGYGQLGDGTGADQYGGIVSTGMTDVANISAGDGFSLILKNTGNNLYSCGWNIAGQLGCNNVTDQISPVLVTSGVQTMAAGGAHSLIVKTDGTLWACGSNFYGQLGNGDASQAEKHAPVEIAW